MNMPGRCQVSARTPGPWRIYDTHSGEHFEVRSADGSLIAGGSNWSAQPVKGDRALWEQIVASINQEHDTTETARAAHRVTLARITALEAALRDVLGWYEHSDVRDIIGRKLGEQADYHRKLNAARRALAGEE